MGIKGSSDIVNDGLVMYLDVPNIKSYKLGSLRWYDIIDNTKFATLVNGTAYNASNNGILELDGINDQITISNMILPNNFTIDMWYYVTITSGYNHYFMLNNLIFFGGIWVYPTLNYPFFWATRNNANLTNDLYSSIAPNLNQWNNITISCEYNGINYIKRIYMNGRIGGTSTVNEIQYLNTPLTFYIGGSYVPNVPTKTQNFKLYHRVLSNSEVLQNYNAMRGRFGL